MIDFDLDIREIDGMAGEPEATYEVVNRELNMAWEIVEETGANLFLTGRAGTGKTTFLKRLRERSAKRMVVLAPTGVAAINAAGNTIHSFFQLPFAPYVPGRGFLTNDKKYLNMSKLKKRLISSLSLLVIDEISMVRPDMLDAIDSILRRLRGSTRPFGGLQLLLIGDLRQLPPVVREQEWELLKDHYPTPYFFESQALKKAGFQTVELSMVYRQSDSRFIDLLNSIRDGSATAGELRLLNARAIPGFSPADSEGYIRLTTHNYRASAINDQRLAALPGEEFSFEADIKGDFPESSFPAERVLRLREGAQVMFVKNDTGSDRRYYNGLIGTVTGISENKIIVRPHGAKMGAEDPGATGVGIEVEKAEWDNTRYNIDAATGEVTQDSVGTFSQYPLQLAWAITIHKSQGLTFDRAVIDASHSFAPGQTYVALSRCRSLEGLVLDRPIPPGAVITDSGINSFEDRYISDAPDQARVAMLKNAYLHTLLAELFDFEPLRRSFEAFSRHAREYLAPKQPGLDARLDDLGRRIDSDLCQVSRRFIASCAGRPLDAELAATDDRPSTLAGRICNGCGYFLDTIRELEAFLKTLPRQIANKAAAKRLDNTFDAVATQTDMKRLLLSQLKTTDFSIKSYLDAKGRAMLKIDSAPGAR